MLDLSKVVKKNIAREDVTGKVITHGTETLEETEYIIDLITNSENHNIVDGTMRNNSELGYDGAANISKAIICSISKSPK